MAKFPRTFRSLLLAAALSPVSLAHADTLLEIYELALKNDPVLKAAEATFRAGKEAEVQGRAALLPHVGAQASYGESDLSTKSKYNFFSNPFNQDLKGEDKNYYLNLDQKIFDLSAWFSFKQGKELSREAAARFAADQESLIIRTTEAYVNVLRAMDNLKSSRAEEAAFQRQLEQTQQRFAERHAPSAFSSAAMLPRACASSRSRIGAWWNSRSRRANPSSTSRRPRR